MMITRSFTVLVIIFSCHVLLTGQDIATENGLKAINEDVIRSQVSFLASDWMEGRETGEKGVWMAGDYIAGMLQLYGVKPYGDPVNQGGLSDNMESPRSYFQNFVLLRTLPGKNNAMHIRSVEGGASKITMLTEGVDFMVRTSDPSFEINAPVVFAGYAFKDDKTGYNDFAKLDIKGKFILKVSGFPGFMTENMTYTERYRLSVRMDSIIASLGALGIIEFNPDTRVIGQPAEEDFMNLSPSEGHPQTGRPRANFSIPGEKISDTPKRVYISGKAASGILSGTGIDPHEYIRKADKREQYTISRQTGHEVFLRATVETSQVAVRNIIGIIEGKRSDEVIVLGAHYDHVGMHNGYIWNGADDNASGTAGIMTLAKAITESGVKPEKTIIIALWAAEEVGLLGSRYYVGNTGIPLSNIKLNLNFDMISRYISDDEPNKVTMTYTDKYSFFRDMTEKNLAEYNIDLQVDYQPSPDPPGGSDHRSFVAKGIPVMRFKPGHREEYHQPGDESKTLDWDIMEKIIEISYLNIWQLANSEW